MKNSFFIETNNSTSILFFFYFIYIFLIIPPEIQRDNVITGTDSDFEKIPDLTLINPKEFLKKFYPKSSKYLKNIRFDSLK
jgi:hypothetical protein